MIQLSIKKVGNSTANTASLKKISPIPQKAVWGTESIVLDENVKITLKYDTDASDQILKPLPNLDIDIFVHPKWTFEEFSHRILKWMNLRLNELGSQFQFDQKQITAKTEKIFAEFPIESIPQANRTQAYYFNASKQGVDVLAWTMQGLFYGIITLTQLLEIEKDEGGEFIKAPTVEIWDWPQYIARGLVDDISRGQRPTIDNFKKWIQYLARTKQNVLALSMEDIIYFKSNPNIGKGRGVLMPEDIKVLQDYAKEWFVTIIPAIQVFGHLDNMLYDPEFMPYAEFPGAFCFDTTNPKSRELIRQMLQDTLPLFETPVFSPMCDESFDFGQGNSRKYVEKMGYGKALGEWYQFLIEEIKKAGKQVIFLAHDVDRKSVV